MTPAGTSNELDVQNGWEENTHTHCVGRYKFVWALLRKYPGIFSGLFRKNLNASKPSEHPPQVEECLKV